MKKYLSFLFSSLAVFWVVLATCEFFMPGFVIYYINLAWFLAVVFMLGFVVVLFSPRIDSKK